MARERRNLEQGDYEVMAMPTSVRSAIWSDFNYLPQVLEMTNYFMRLHAAVADGDGLFIAGPHMTGKSYFSAYVAKLFRSYNYTVMWGNAIDIQDNISERREWDRDEGNYERRYRSVDVLVIDGLGNEASAVGKWGRNRVKEIIDYRLQWNKTMIVNTSKTAAQIDEIYREGFANFLGKHLYPVLMKKNFTLDPSEKNRMRGSLNG